MRLVTVVGARPQFIKAAAVSRAIARLNAASADGSRVEEILVHTGQHFDHGMSEVFFEEMDIPRPAHHLGVAALPHGAMTGRMLERVEEVLEAEAPDAVLVYGDTNSTLAGALAAVKRHVPVAHVEAGLRSFNRRMPEEINRLVADRVSSLLFCPTEAAVANLRAEGVAAEGVLLVGDVMFDAALHYAAQSAERSRILADPPAALAGLDLSAGFVLATVHRQENTDDPARLRAVFGALDLLSRDLPVVAPLHPRTRACLAREGVAPASPRVALLDPVGYFDMAELLKACSLVATDSGGVQKEAYFFRKPCVTLRAETEWVELVERGWNRLAWGDARTTAEAARSMLGRAVEPDPSLYGGGAAADRIARRLAQGLPPL